MKNIIIIWEVLKVSFKLWLINLTPIIFFLICIVLLVPKESIRETIKWALSGWFITYWQLVYYGLCLFISSYLMYYVSKDIDD